jgi:arylformamidase
MRVIDLSHPIAPAMPTYPGLPGPIFSTFLTREASRQRYGGNAEFQIDVITMAGNTGTYLDTPFHRFSTGRDLSTIDLDRHVNLPGFVVTVDPEVRTISKRHLPQTLPKGCALLFHTGWDRHWNSDAYGVDAPHIDRSVAEAALEAGVALVGIDSLNIDDTTDSARPAHTILLQHDVAIVEHLCRLHEIDGGTFRFFAIAPAIRGFGSFPVRALAIVEPAKTPEAA